MQYACFRLIWLALSARCHAHKLISETTGAYNSFTKTETSDDTKAHAATRKSLALTTIIYGTSAQHGGSLTRYKTLEAYKQQKQR